MQDFKPSKHDLEFGGEQVRRRSSVLMRQDLTIDSTLGSHQRGHSSWPVATGHLITAVIGAGVLSLPHSMAWLGWVGGLVAMVVFFFITLWCMMMLASLYEVKGRRHTRYREAVFFILGPRASSILSFLQHLTMVLFTIGYHIAAAQSMSYIAAETCKLTGATTCMNQYWTATVIFGAVQILMSQLPNLESAWWSSIIGAAMSIGYSAVAIALGAMDAHQGGGTIQGAGGASLSQKVFGVFNSLGAVSTAYTSAIVLIEIQDTLKEPPKAYISMKKTLYTGLSSTAVIYIAVSVLDYLALGNAAPDNVLLGFRNAPIWVTLAGNYMVLIHMVSAYQVYAQPVYATTEDLMLRCCPSLALIKEWIVRGIYRTLYVAITAVIAIALPFFSAFIGLIGAVNYWPTGVFFPIQMYKVVYKPKGPILWLMNLVNVMMALVSLMSITGALESIVAGASAMKPFQSLGTSA